MRHNIEAIEAAGGDIRRVVAVGGGTQGGLWTQIVSDITGRPQQIPPVTIGASYGAAFLAAGAVQPTWTSTGGTRSGEVREPRPALAADYDELYGLYRAAVRGLEGRRSRVGGPADPFRDRARARCR